MAGRSRRAEWVGAERRRDGKKPQTTFHESRSHLVVSEGKPRRAVNRNGEESGEMSCASECVKIRVDCGSMLLLQEPKRWVRSGFVLKPNTEQVDWEARGEKRGCSSLGYEGAASSD